MRNLDVPDWGFCTLWHFWWYTYALQKVCLKFGWNLLSLKASLTRTLSKIDDITGVVAFLMVHICSAEALFEIWLKSFEFEGIKNSLIDRWYCWRFGGCWRLLTGADVLDHDWNVFLKVHGVYVSNFVKIWCLEAEIWWVQFCQIWCFRRGAERGAERGGEVEIKDQPRLINNCPDCSWIIFIYLCF